MRNIRKLFVLFFIILVSNSNVTFAKDIESGIICSGMLSNGNDHRFGHNNYKRFFAPTIKITNEYIYLSTKNVKEKNIIWHDKIKNSLQSYE